jgi:hypothetical protein
MHIHIVLPAIRQKRSVSPDDKHSQFPLFVYRVTIMNETV